MGFSKPGCIFISYKTALFARNTKNKHQLHRSIAKHLNVAVQLPKNCIVLWKFTQKLSQSLNCSILVLFCIYTMGCRENAVDCTGKTYTYTDTYIYWKDESKNCRFFFLISLLQWMYFFFKYIWKIHIGNGGCSGLTRYNNSGSISPQTKVLYSYFFFFKREPKASCSSKKQVIGFYYFVVVAPLNPKEQTFLLEMSPHWEKTHWEMCYSNTRWSFQNKPVCFSQWGEGIFIPFSQNEKCTKPVLAAHNCLPLWLRILDFVSLFTVSKRDLCIVSSLSIVSSKGDRPVAG